MFFGKKPSAAPVSTGLLTWARSYVERELEDLAGDPRRIVVKQRKGESSRETRPVGRSPQSIRASAARELELGAWRVLVVVVEPGDDGEVVIACEAWQRDVREALRFVQPAKAAFGGTLKLIGALRPDEAPDYPPA
ncbi:hypothetical protein SAMN03159343_0548 [Klenkia marina]|uniref:Uncharacterized protein n=1 Tax=Klenkia marina TaxID=1960309 RepID=A0A1G4XCN5_9ACTN|nr:hypothetical protein [Klenkia marina]SCX38956.1 hypothetical protein SAMN03159343_0548 [Klenkia marina]